MNLDTLTLRELEHLESALRMKRERLRDRERKILKDKRTCDGTKNLQMHELSIELTINTNLHTITTRAYMAATMKGTFR